MKPPLSILHTNNRNPMDFDDVLNLEQKFYDEGFHEGQTESTRKSYVEGKEYGLQVGFQKYVLMGQIQTIVDLLQNGVVKEPLSGQAQTQLQQLRELLDQVKMDNEYGNVLGTEKLLIKMRNRMRILSNLVKKQVTMEQLDDTASLITGLEKEKKSQPTIGNLNDDNMW